MSAGDRKNGVPTTVASIPLVDPHAPKADPSVGDLVKDATAQVSTLVRAEVELAKAEITRDVKKGLTGSVYFILALVVLFYSTFFLFFFVAELLDTWLLLGGHEHVLAEIGRCHEAFDPGDGRSGRVVFVARGESGDIDGAGPDQREDAAIRLFHIGLASDLVHREVLEHPGAGFTFGVDPEFRFADPQDPHVGLEVALAVEQGRVTAFVQAEAFDIVRDLSLEELRGFAAGDGQAEAVGPVEQAAFLADLTIFGVEAGEGCR